MGLNSFQLKWIAIITMVIDHVGAVLFPHEMWFRMIGRIAFPIFCFLIVEGFFHTKDIYRYMMRLGIFAILSEIPYDLAFHGKLLETSGQNIFFTLALGVLLMYMLERSDSTLLRVVEIVSIMCLAALLRTDYDSGGILLIFIYYVFRGRKWVCLGTGAAWNFLMGLQSVQCYGTAATLFLAFYNGERGPKIKYLFYVFYPAHLLVLYGISRYINFS